MDIRNTMLFTRNFSELLPLSAQDTPGSCCQQKQDELLRQPPQQEPLWRETQSEDAQKSSDLEGSNCYSLVAPISS